LTTLGLLGLKVTQDLLDLPDRLDHKVLKVFRVSRAILETQAQQVLKDHKAKQALKDPQAQQD
jgi:predicted CoA-binding protein